MLAVTFSEISCCFNEKTLRAIDSVKWHVMSAYFCRTDIINDVYILSDIVIYSSETNG